MASSSAHVRPLVQCWNVGKQSFHWAEARSHPEWAGTEPGTVPAHQLSWVSADGLQKSALLSAPVWRAMCRSVMQVLFWGGFPVARTFGKGSVPAVIPVAFLWPELWKVTLGLYTWAIRFNGSHLHSLKAGYSPIRCPSLLCLRIALSAICKAIRIQYHLQILLKGFSGQMSAVNAGADEPGVFHLQLLPPLCPFWRCFQVKHMCLCFKRLFRLQVIQTVLFTGAECELAAWRQHPVLMVMLYLL